MEEKLLSEGAHDYRTETGRVLPAAKAAPFGAWTGSTPAGVTVDTLENDPVGTSRDQKAWLALGLMDAGQDWAVLGDMIRPAGEPCQ